MELRISNDDSVFGCVFTLAPNERPHKRFHENAHFLFGAYDNVVFRTDDFSREKKIFFALSLKLLRAEVSNEMKYVKHGNIAKST